MYLMILKRHATLCVSMSHIEFDLSLYGFNDADWAYCPLTSHSTTDFYIYLGVNCISWSTKKQLIVSSSSVEAEYRSIASTTTKLTWITFLLCDISISFLSAPQLFCDNISALHMSMYPIIHARSKYIELYYHFVCENIAIGTLVTRYVPLSSQHDDIFIKQLSNPPFLLAASWCSFSTILQLERAC